MRLNPLSRKGVESSPVSLENYTIFSSVTFTYTGFSASFPFIVIFLDQVKHVPLSQVGIIYVVSGILGILGQPVAGRMVDLIGTRTMAILGTLSTAALYGLLSAFVLAGSPVLAYMIVYPVLNLMNNLSQLALSSHISDRPTEKMASGMSLLYVGLNLGFTFGPVSGGFLIALYGYSSIFTFGAVTSLAATFVTAAGIKTNPKFALRSIPDEKVSRKKGRMHMPLFFYFVLIMVSWLAIGYQAIPLSTYESSFLSLSTITIGVVLTTNGLLITLFQMPISRWIGVERKMRLAPIALGSAVMAAGFVILGSASSFILIEAAVTLTTVGEMMVAVPTQVVATMFSREYNRGKYQGYYFTFSRAGIAASSYVGPAIFSIFVANAYIGWYIIAGVSLLTGLGYYLVSPALEKEHSMVIAEDG